MLASWNLHKLPKLFQIVRNLIDLISEHEHNMK